MRHWQQIAVRNLRTRYSRSLVAVAAVALGVALATAIAVGYTSARHAILMWNYSWVGHSQVHVQPISASIWASQRMPRSLADEIGRLEGVERVITRQKEELELPGGQLPGVAGRTIVAAYGVEPRPPSADSEAIGISARLRQGRMIHADGEVLVEQSLLESLGRSIGQTIRLGGWGEAAEFRIVGVIRRPRVDLISTKVGYTVRPIVMISQADMNKLFADRPIVTPNGEPAGLEAIDVVLADGSERNIRRMVEQIRALPQVNSAVQVSGADEEVARLDRNMELLRLVSWTVAVVGLLTASYIIFATLGMGMVQQQVELGVLRCVGAGRAQAAAVIVLEAAPIAIAGIALGLAAGLLAAQAIIAHYHEFFARLVVSGWDLTWAALGGLVAVALAVALPAWMASRVSPLAATRPQTRRIPLRLDLALGVIGLALIGLSMLIRSPIPGRLFGFDYGPAAQMIAYLSAGAPMLFLGYFLVMPVIVASVGWLVKFIAAGLLMVRPRLLDDQMQTARWRTAATAGALMVGISMLVNLRVHSESVIRGWNLPTQMPAGFVYFFEPLTREQVRKVESYPQVVQSIPIMSFWANGQTPGGFVSVNFLAGPVERLEKLVEVSFAAGDKESAFAALRRGDGVIVTREFATRYRVRLGQPIQIWGADPERARHYRVAGIIESMTLDMAIDFLNVRDRFANIASGTIIGSVAQANHLLLAPGQADPPPGPAEPAQASIIAFDFAGSENVGQTKVLPPPETQQLMLRQVSEQLQADRMPDFWAGSLEDLRRMIVGEFRSVASILQQIALYATMIASLGVGFAMAANVHSRRRQLAVLRAVGTTKLQLARLVLAEAVTIALIGSLMGIAHGQHLAANAIYFDRVRFGLPLSAAPQWAVIGLAITVAVACCLAASVPPALRAGRTNIVAAMRQV